MASILPMPLQNPLLPAEAPPQLSQRLIGGWWRRAYTVMSAALLVVGATCAAFHGAAAPSALDGSSDQGDVDWASGLAEELPGASDEFFKWLGLFGFVAAFVVVGVLLLQSAIVKALKLAIEKYDRVYFGVDIEIGHMRINCFIGRLELRDCTVHNPEGFKGKYLLKGGHFVFDLNIARAMWSLFREIEVEEFTARDIEVNYEIAGHVRGKTNVAAILDFYYDSQRSKGDIDAVYDFWHEKNGSHTFHFNPAWEGEVRGNFQFFAYKHQVPGTDPVYDFWHWWNREHTFHFLPAWDQERAGHPQFYAFKEPAPGTEPVHCFWHSGNRDHTFHFLPAWGMEETRDIQFHAYKQDPTHTAIVIQPVPVLKPVYAFWHAIHGQHTFHFLPAWGGERQGGVVFYAYDKPSAGNVAVYDFWHAGSGRKTFHTGGPRPGEVRRSALFYVFPNQVAGSEPVAAFWHGKNNEVNIHLDNPWEGEQFRGVQFYAYRTDIFSRRFVFRKVALEGLKARSASRLGGASVAMDSIMHEDFSAKFDAQTAYDVCMILGKELFRHVSLNLEARPHAFDR